MQYGLHYFGSCRIRRECGRSTSRGSLGWEFVDAGNLRAPVNRANVDPTLSALFTSINVWIYEWRDVVASCAILTEKDLRQLSEISPLIRIVRLRMPQDTNLSVLADRHSPFNSDELSACKQAGARSRGNLLTINSSQRTNEIVANIVSALVLKRGSPYAQV